MISMMVAAFLLAAEQQAGQGAGHSYAAPPIHLQYNDFCAGSPLTVGASYGDGNVTDIHVVTNPHDVAVGWIYQLSSGRSYLQANHRMSGEDQQSLKVTAYEAVSQLRPKPKGLPIDLNVRPCLASEVSSF